MLILLAHNGRNVLFHKDRPREVCVSEIKRKIDENGNNSLGKMSWRGKEKHERSFWKMDINEEAWLLDGTRESGNTEGRRNDTRREMRGKEANFFTKSVSAAGRYSTHPIDYNLLFHAFTASSSENDKRSFREV